ncbi:MAG: hypothetical protein IPO85_14125 [Saprospiraceae bacterium]|uniref:Uncharacterized protein n=1 Tax=Candidatus Defluviibacterium haderslevense TaxID=2981993 RepID=A0A9D7S9T3_9BACT|nr:hypothetical protein [Candidatus Defluviibacterium haderslevense]
MKTLQLFLICIILCCNLSCKKDDPIQIDPWSENIKLIPPGSDFYLVADVEGIPGVDKIIYPSLQDQGSKGITRAICKGDECHTIFTMGDPTNTQKFWFAIVFQKKGLNGFDNLIHEGKYNFSTPSNMTNGTYISFTSENRDEFRTDYLDNNKIESSHFEIIKINDVFGNQYIEIRFNCQLNSLNGQTIYLKNALMKINW